MTAGERRIARRCVCECLSVCLSDAKCEAESECLIWLTRAPFIVLGALGGMLTFFAYGL